MLQKKRDVNLDILKGIGMLLVVFAHTHLGKLTSAIYTFHMPLFFIASGCLFALGKGGSIKDKWRSLMIPYFTFSILCFLYWWLVESKARGVPDCNQFDNLAPGINCYLQQFANIPLAIGGCHAFEYNVVLWFLPCLFVSYIIYIHLNRCKSTIQIGGGVLLYLLFLAIHHFFPTLPWYSDIALLGVTYFIIGRFGYNQLAKQIKSTPIAIAVFIISALLIWIATGYKGASLNMKQGNIPAFWWLYTVPLLGFAMVWSVSFIIKEHGYKTREILLWLGSNTLLIMCIHEPIKRIILKLILTISPYSDMNLMRENILLSLLTAVLVLVTCYPFSIIITKFAPWMLGKRTKLNK